MDQVNVAELLAELETTSQIKRYDIGQRSFGMIRNFGKFQSPRRPSSSFPKPADLTEWQSFTAIRYDTPTSSPTVTADNDGNCASSTSSVPDNVGREACDGDGDGKGEEIITTMMTGRDGKPYAFSGQVIRLNRKDYDRMKSRYHAIPDIDAELWNLDDHYVRKGSEDWFHRLPKSLAAKHQELLAKKPKLQRGSVPF